IALITAFVLSLTFVPAMIAIFVSADVQETEYPVVRNLKMLYQPALAMATRSPMTVIAAAIILCLGAAVVFACLGQEFTPALDEKNIVMEIRRIPSTSLAQSQAMQLSIERAVSRRPQVAFV